MMNNEYKRGTVWWVDLPLDTSTHIQGGPRPCVILSNHIERSGVVTVCPLSTRVDDIPTHVKVCVKKEGQVLCEQITTIDISNLGDFCGNLSESDLENVDAVMSDYLGLTFSESVRTNDDSRLCSIEQKLNRLSKLMEFFIWRDGNDTIQDYNSADRFDNPRHRRGIRH